MTNSADPDQLIWVHSICKFRAYPGSAGLGLMLNTNENMQIRDFAILFSYFILFFFSEKVELGILCDLSS